MSNLSNFIDAENLHATEGETGMRNLTRICEEIGYAPNGFAYGTPIEQFIMDNPGLHEVMHNWIDKHYADELDEYAEVDQYDLEDDDDE